MNPYYICSQKKTLHTPPALPTDQTHKASMCKTAAGITENVSLINIVSSSQQYNNTENIYRSLAKGLFECNITFDKEYRIFRKTKPEKLVKKVIFKVIETTAECTAKIHIPPDVLQTNLHLNLLW